MLTRKQLEQAESLLDQLEKEAEESQRAIEVLLKRKQLAKNRLDAETAKAPDLASTDTKNAIKDKRDLVQQQLDKPLSEEACEKAEQRLGEIEDMVVEAAKEVEEKKLGVEVAKEIQKLSRTAMEALNKVIPPEGYKKLDARTDLPNLLRAAAAYKPVEEFESVIGDLVKRTNEPKRDKIQALIGKAEELKKAIKDAGEEAVAELEDLVGKIENQHDLFRSQSNENEKMLDKAESKLKDPVQIVKSLLDGWPKGITRPTNLEKILYNSLDLSDLKSRHYDNLELAQKESELKPWTNADWLGKVMPTVQSLCTDLRKTHIDIDKAALKVVLENLDTAVKDKIKEDKESQISIKGAVNGGNKRKELVEKFGDSAASIYKEIMSEIESGNIKKITDQLLKVDEKFKQREKDFKESQEKLSTEAEKSGLQKVDPDPSIYSGKQYTLLGMQAKYTVYARLDDALKSHKTNGGFLNVFQTALGKGIIPPKSTGSDGVKLEPYGWVVKVTLAAASAYGGLDNTESPHVPESAEEKVDDPPTKYLNFTQWTNRH